jgi:hypothetical protein
MLMREALRNRSISWLWLGQAMSSIGAVPVDEVAQPKALTAEGDGFNLHAATHFNADDREAIERLCRHAARGPLALTRLSLADKGNVVYRLKAPRPDGTTHLVFTPHSF